MEAWDYKNVFALIAMGMTIWAHIPYFIETIKGSNRPHIFTWVLWTLLTFIAAAAQVVGNAGPGAWVTITTGIICVAITIAAFYKGEKSITRSDWVMFILGLSAIPIWMMTSDPLFAVIIVSAIDVSAVIPTVRKAWNKPFEENSFMYGFNIPRHILSIVSIQSFSIVTVLYPLALLIMNAAVYGVLKARRKKMASCNPS